MCECDDFVVGGRDGKSVGTEGIVVGVYVDEGWDVAGWETSSIGVSSCSVAAVSSGVVGGVCSVALSEDCEAAAVP